MSVINTIITTAKEKCDEAYSNWTIFGIIIIALALAFGSLCLCTWIFSLVWELLLIGVFALALPTFSFWGYMGVMLGLSLTLNFIGKRLFRPTSIKVTTDD